MKEGSGDDSVTAGWTGPGIGTDLTVIDGAFLSPWLRPAARGPIPDNGAIDADVTALEWAPGDGAVSHAVYLSTDETIDAADLVGETQLTIQVVVLDPGATYYWRVDETDADGVVTEGNPWSFSTIPLEAHFPNPADGAEGLEPPVTLSWTAGKVVIMHDVYFGTDEAAIAARDMTTFKGKLMTASYDPGPLDLFTTYYWAIDQFTPTGTVEGPVWSFTIVTPKVMLAEMETLILTEVNSGGIDAELEGPLLAKVNAASAALDRGNPNDAKVAMNDLKALINQIEAQTGKKITPESAATIIQEANAIIAEQEYYFNRCKNRQ